MKKLVSPIPNNNLISDTFRWKKTGAGQNGFKIVHNLHIAIGCQFHQQASLFL
jgi:hypothetical protein